MSNMYMVLGYKENLVVEKYREKQYVTLVSLLRENIDEKDFNTFQKISEEKKRKFLFHPDQSSILKCLHFIEDPKIHIEKLGIELKKLLNGEEDLVMNSWTLIEGTNIRLTIEDNNPLNAFDAHPDSDDGSGWKLGWGTQSPEEWKNVYDNTFALLKKIDEGFFNELNGLLQKIVAFGTAKHIHYSASYKECVGTLYMWYTLDTDIPELHVLEWLVHESTHNKLNLIMQYEDITLNDFKENFYSPYRPDARHVYGVFLGIHALTPTVHVLLQWEKKGLVTDTRWLEKIVLYHMKNKIGIATMKKFGMLSPMGKQVFQDIMDVAQASDPLIKDIIVKYKLPVQEIQKRAKEHFMKVNKEYPNLQY